MKRLATVRKTDGRKDFGLRGPASGKSPVIGLLFYLMPAVVDITVGVFFFISAKRMADSGANSYKVALTMTLWALCYAVTSFSTGRFITRDNAIRVLKVSQFVLLISLLGLACTDDLNLQFVWLMGTGLGGALFFTSSQSVIKLISRDEYGPETMIRNSACYTFSWSIGMALGPFIAAFIWGLFDPESGWRYCYLIAFVLQLSVAVGVFVLDRNLRRLRKQPENPEESAASVKDAAGHAAAGPADTRPRLPDLMAAGWCLQGLGYIAIAMMRTYLPDYCTGPLAMSTFHQGIVMSLISFAQAFAGLACCTARRWPYRPWTVGAVSLAGAAAFLIFAGTGDWRLYAFAAVLFGMFSGVMCFTATFHALVNSARTARYVAVNETLVGVGSVVAPMLGAFLATYCNLRAPFFCCMGCLVLCAVLYTAYTWKTRNLDIMPGGVKAAAAGTRPLPAADAESRR